MDKSRPEDTSPLSPVEANQLALRQSMPLRLHTDVLKFIEAPTDICYSKSSNDILNEPCHNGFSTHHRLHECGHVIRTQKPSLCGVSCNHVVVEPRFRLNVCKEAFACPRCAHELLNRKFQQREAIFEAEMAIIAGQLDYCQRKDNFVSREDDMAQVRQRQLANNQSMWADEWEKNWVALTQVPGMRTCDAVYGDDEKPEYLLMFLQELSDFSAWTTADRNGRSRGLLIREQQSKLIL